MPVQAHPEDRLRLALLDAAPDGLALVSSDGTILLATPRLEGMFGYPTGGLRGRLLEELLPEPLRDLHAGHRAAYHQAPAVKPMGVGRHLVGRRLDATELPVEVSLSPLETDAYGVCVIAAIRDETTRREAALLQARAETARQQLKIAEELADTVIARLFGAGLNLAGALDLCDDSVQARLHVAIRDIDDVIRALRTAIFDLGDPGAGG